MSSESEREELLTGRAPVDTRYSWDAVQMQRDGEAQNYVVLRVETAQGTNTYFMPKDIALKVAAGIGSYAHALPDEEPSSLIVPDVDMSDVVRHLNGKGNQN